MTTVQDIMNWKKKGLCPYCGKMGKPYLFTRICKEHGEYWDAIYLNAIDELLSNPNEGDKKP